MTNALKLFLVTMLTVVLAACAGRDTVEPTETTPSDDRGTPVDTGGVDDQPRLDPNDTSDPENLGNPDSILYQRVILFDFDQSTIKPEYRRVLAAHAQLLAANPNLEVILEGHADERGTREYNLGLGERRGNAVSDVVDAQGASAGQLSVVSYGEERPASRCSDERCWSANRRVEIVYPRR